MIGDYFIIKCLACETKVYFPARLREKFFLKVTNQPLHFSRNNLLYASSCPDCQIKEEQKISISHSYNQKISIKIA